MIGDTEARLLMAYPNKGTGTSKTRSQCPYSARLLTTTRPNMSTPSDASNRKAPVPDHENPQSRDVAPGASRKEPLSLPGAKIQLSAWSVVAFCCLGLAVLANAICWVSFRGGIHPDPTGLGGLAVFAAFFFSTLVPTFVGTVCAWFGFKQQPVRKGLAVTALVMNGVPFGLCLLLWLLPLIL
jgi:hypothetical protein